MGAFLFLVYVDAFFQNGAVDKIKGEGIDQIKKTAHKRKEPRGVGAEIGIGEYFHHVRIKKTEQEHDQKSKPLGYQIGCKAEDHGKQDLVFIFPMAHHDSEISALNAVYKLQKQNQKHKANDQPSLHIKHRFQKKEEGSDGVHGLLRIVHTKKHEDDNGKTCQKTEKRREKFRGIKGAFLHGQRMSQIGFIPVEGGTEPYPRTHKAIDERTEHHGNGRTVHDPFEDHKNKGIAQGTEESGHEPEKQGQNIKHRQKAK